MAQSSLFWDGTSVGDAGPYDSDTFTDWVRKFLLFDRTIQGVVKGYENELEVTNPAGTTIRVNTGGAVVDGSFYENTAAVDFSVTVPGAGSNYYMIVLRKSWTLQTVRLAIIGPSAAPNLTLTQTDGTTWEIPLADVSVTSGGTITIYKRYRMLAPPLAVGMSVRQGGDAKLWELTGTTTYALTGAYMQVGCGNWAGGAAASGSFVVTLPEAYGVNYETGALQNRSPISFVMCNSSAVIARSVVLDPTQIQIFWSDPTAATHTSLNFNWFVIGDAVLA